MDAQTAKILTTILPPELVAEIETHLIAAYRRQNARSVKYIINDELKYSFDVHLEYTEIVVERRRKYTYWSCPICRDLSSRKLAARYPDWETLGIPSKRESDHQLPHNGYVMHIYHKY